MAQVAPNKPKGSGESSDWECTNCGATLTNVNNVEIIARTETTYRCVCNGVLKVTRNSPFVKPATGKAAQKVNQGGGVSYPGP